jgi:hypothetical protein
VIGQAHGQLEDGEGGVGVPRAWKNRRSKDVETWAIEDLQVSVDNAILAPERHPRSAHVMSTGDLVIGWIVGLVQKVGFDAQTAGTTFHERAPKDFERHAGRLFVEFRSLPMEYGPRNAVRVHGVIKSYAVFTDGLLFPADPDLA